LSGVGLIGWALISGGDIRAFIDPASMAITGGGTVAATLINFRLGQVVTAVRLALHVFRGARHDHVSLIRTVVAFAERARRDGLLALEDEAESLDDPFLKKGIRLVVDGTDPELVRTVLETELSYQQERHRLGQSVFSTMAALSPAFGMIGTLIGLIQMLRNLENPDAIGPGLAVALITTFYGAIMAYLLFNPMAGKLRVASEEETLFREMAIEGVLSIQAGDNPRVVQEKLWAFLPPSLRERAEGAERAGEAPAGREGEATA
ncbi:MAG TPA: motility protein A, partial [Bacillota bacterium]